MNFINKHIANIVAFTTMALIIASIGFGISSIIIGSIPAKPKSHKEITSEIQEDGYEAAELGVSSEANPEYHTAYKRAWLEGWKDYHRNKSNRD